jgi:HSP20 family molecular chaperone IbpA
MTKKLNYHTPFLNYADLFTKLEKENLFSNHLTNSNLENGEILLEVPGFTKDDLTIELDGDLLLVKGEKTIHKNNYSVYKKILIPSDYFDKNEITAEIENGLLFIKLKKTEKERKKLIEIK